MPEIFSYVLVPSVFGTLSIVWWETGVGPRVQRIFLPNERTSGQNDQTPGQSVFRMTFPDASPLSCPAITALAERMQRFLGGDGVSFELDHLSILALERCSEFQRRVLLAEHKIPRGWVSTYGRIARNLGVPGGARAVGGALARNPFPIVIPCHRAIRSDGQLGGFQGGLEMKRALLEREGIKISPVGKVLTDRFYY